MDDDEVDEQRRYDYRVIKHLDAYHDGDGEEANDRNSYLMDESTNPELVLLEAEGRAEHSALLVQLSEAKESLLPQQQELIHKKLEENRTNTSIAAEEGVTEAAIRNRFNKIKEKLRKKLS